MRNLRITTSEIAKICNVSQGTVDRAINNRTDINPETKKKILDVAKQYGYRNYIDTKFDKIEGQIGIIVFNLNNEFFSKLITEIEVVLREEGLGAIVMMSHYDKQYEIECIRNLYNSGAKGVIICSVNHGVEFENYLKLFDFPIVATGNKIESIPYVGIDDFAAMQEMTKRILEDKPENIVYFSPALKYSDAYAQRLRYEGFLDAIGNERYSIVTNIDDIREKYEENTVIICSNDYYALQVYFKSTNAKVVGFDNITAIERYKLPIDSVEYSITEIAKAALDLIKGKIDGNVIIKHNIVKHIV